MKQRGPKLTILSLGYICRSRSRDLTFFFFQFKKASENLKKEKKIYTWHLTYGMWVPRQRRSGQNTTWGPKLPKIQYIGGCFVFKLVRGP